nr:hypothetical protein CFP56_28746 [Quercus suber]
MRSTSIVLAIGASIFASTVMSAVVPRTSISDQFLLRFFKEKCDDMASGDYESFPYYDGNTADVPGDCIGPGNAYWGFATVKQDSQSSYEVDFYSGEACTGFIFVSHGLSYSIRRKSSLLLARRTKTLAASPHQRARLSFRPSSGKSSRILVDKVRRRMAAIDSAHPRRRADHDTCLGRVFGSVRTGKSCC